MATVGVGATLDLSAAAADAHRAAYKSADGVALTAEGRRPPVRLKYEDYPAHLIAAVTMAEDHTFFENYGVSVLGKVRAAARDLSCFCLRFGGSSITEQTVKLHWTGSWPDPVRKLVEPLFAIGVTITNSKEEIISDYLSTAYFGGWRNGVDSAASRCWRKTVSEVSLNDSTLLASGLSAPARFKCGRNVSQKGRDLLDRMRDAGHITPAQRASVKRSPLRRGGQTASPLLLAWCVDYAVNIGVSTGDKPVVLTCNDQLQSIVMRAIAKYMKALPREQIGVVVMNLDGRILAYAGGRSADNRAVDRVLAKRSFNSQVKVPSLLTLLRAGWTLDDLVQDDAMQGCANFSPRNSDRRYLGPLSLRASTALSRNPPFVKELCPFRHTAWPRALATFGIDAPEPVLPSHLIGAFEVSLLDVTSMMAAVGSGSGPVKPFIAADQQPEAQQGDPIPEAPLICSALRSAVRFGTARAADVAGAVAKTGSGPTDGAIAGIVGNLAIGVRIGPDRGGRTATFGGGIPAKIFAQIAADAVEAGLVAPHRCGEAVDEQN